MFPVLTCMLVFAAPPQTPKPILPAPDAQVNLLGNGGFENWNLGNQVMGSIPPDLWLPMGTTAGLFTQSAVEITRASSAGFGLGKGSFVLEMTANAFGTYLSQPLENFGEFRGRKVTFSVDVGTPFSVSAPRIAIDDGISASESGTTITMSTTERLTVTHIVNAGATKLEFKLFADQTTYFDNAQASLGTLQSAVFRPRSNPEPGLVEVPLGTVLDWYRFNASIPVPEGYAIADGSAVLDAGSPFFGLATINLSDKFVRGVSSVGSIGSQGGADSVNLSHSHSINHSHSEDHGGFYMNAGCCSPLPVIDVDSYSGSSGSALGNVSILPSYVGLLKIMRIK